MQPRDPPLSYIINHVDEHLRHEFGDCTRIYTGSRIAGIHQSTSDIDVIVIGNHQGKYYTTVKDIFVDAGLFAHDTFIEEPATFPLRTKLLLYPNIIRGDPALVQEKQQRLAAALPSDDEAIVQALVARDAGAPYRIRKLAQAGILEQKLRDIHELQKHHSPAEDTSALCNPLKARFGRFFKDLSANRGRAYAKTIGVVARTLEERHWNHCASAFEAAYSASAYSALSDLAHEAYRQATHNAFPQPALTLERPPLQQYFGQPLRAGA